MQSTRIASAHRASCRRCGCVASRCVATQRHKLSVSIDGAPLGRIGTASARNSQHCAGSFRYLTPKKGKAGFQVSNKPFGSGGNTRRCDTKDHVISFLQTVRGDPVACAPSLKPQWTNMGCIQPRHSGLDAPCWALRNFVPTSMSLGGGVRCLGGIAVRDALSQSVNPAAS